MNNTKLETKRLFLSDYKTDDLDGYFTLKSCEQVWNYSTFIPLKEKEQAKKSLDQLITDRNNGKFTYLALYKKHTNVFIGEAGIIGYNADANRCVVGYNLLPQYWNQGYATEIIKELIKYSFEVLKVERLEALVLQNNKASCRALEKNGFSLEGILRNFNRCETGYRNVCYYGMIFSDYIVNNNIL